MRPAPRNPAFEHEYKEMSSQHRNNFTCNLNVMPNAYQYGALATTRNIEVRVMSAQTINRAKTLTDKSDTFVRVTVIRTGEQHNTPICWNTAHPHWYHSLYYSNILQGDYLRVDLYQHSEFSDGSLIATTNVAITPALDFSQRVAANSAWLDAAQQRELCTEYALDGDGGGSVSLILVDRHVVPMLSSTAPAVPYTQFEIHKFTAQVIGTPLAKVAKSALSRMNSAARKIHPFLDLGHPVNHLTRARSTYVIKLRHIDRFFHGKKQTWNHNYDAAKRIFSGSLAHTIQTALIVQHGHLYGKSNLAGPNSDPRRHLLQSTGALLDGLDLLELLAFGIRNGKSRVYTYVVIDGELRFCETGAKILKDVDSKHAMHACASPTVVYAGEMHFRQRRIASEPEYTLVIDNNSGTYAPDAALLPNLRMLFEANFPRLAVEALDFRDPLLIEYNAAVTRTMSEGKIDRTE